MGPRFFKRGDSTCVTTRRQPMLNASMGPRFFKRGDGCENPLASDDSCASMGPRFFKRGDKVRLMALNPFAYGLQWGHASLSVETFWSVWRHADFGQASMGPRFFKRGDGMPLVMVERFVNASMGPRFFKRGDMRLLSTYFVVQERFNGATLL